MKEQIGYEDVKQYLRNYSTEGPTYDFGGLLHLVLVGIDNLRKNMADADILENAHFVTDAQAGFLRRLLEGRPESIEYFKDDIGHSSRTGLL